VFDGKINSIPLVINITAEKSVWSELSDICLPGRLHSEKDASYTNKDGRVQLARKAIRAKHKTKPDWMIICGLMESLGIENNINSNEDVFYEITKNEKSFKGLDWDSIGLYGSNVEKMISDPGRIDVSEFTKAPL
jgi:predicted molibdopterin-dependent oxidoreductase YjgC